MRVKLFTMCAVFGVLCASCGASEESTDVKDAVTGDSSTQDVAVDGCQTDADCSHLQHTACERPVCQPDTRECALETIPDCVACQEPSDCPAAPLCFKAACDKGRCSQAEDNGATCDDGDACTQADACQQGLCVGSDPVLCEALDQCHLPGVCDPLTGECSNPPQLDDTACDDGNPCTQVDVCMNGVCAGTEIDCEALDQCHVPGVCDPLTGECSNPTQEDGFACNDEDLCTQLDVCQQGVCTGTDPVVCLALDQCHVPGICEPTTGECSNPTQEDGFACDDGDLCTQLDTCQLGVCTGTDPLICLALDQCHEAGTCDPLTGICSNPKLPSGTPCEDGDLCTLEDHCQAGTCISGEIMNCRDDLQCTLDYCLEGACHNDVIDGCIPENCTDGVDNNGDGWIDCDDPLCGEDPVCFDPVEGDACAWPYEVFGGDYITSEHVGQLWSHEGDTSTMADDYPPLCWTDPGVPDAVYQMRVAEPVRVRVRHAFLWEDPMTAPYSVLLMFHGVCFPDDMEHCHHGGSQAAEFEDVLLPGTYYFVVTGQSYYYQDWGPYTFTAEVFTVETSETDCTDGIDNDGDGLMDCMDTDCYEVPECDLLPVLADLACGQTVEGTITSTDEEHFYTFTVTATGNIALNWAFEPGSSDYGYVNFYDPSTDPPRRNSLYGTGKTVWHTSNGAGFKATGNVLYVIMWAHSTVGTGNYSLTLTCSDGPETNCSDGLDNDADSYVDCEDSDCYDDPVCNGGISGNTCEEAIPLFGEDPITTEALGESGLGVTMLGTTGTKTNDLSAACAPISAQGPDMVYTFTLADPAELTAMVEFDYFFDVPALYLFSGTCDVDGLVGCGSGFWGWIGYGAVLAPGTYYLAVDSGQLSWSGVPNQGPFLLDVYLDVVPPDEDCTNGEDDNGNGKIDCEDPVCFADEACTGGASGESCADPFLINAGNPLPEDFSAALFNTTIGKDNSHSHTCQPVTSAGPDSVHKFVLDAAASVTLRVQFVDGFTPVLLLYAGDCQAASLVSCLTAEWDTATLSELNLEAGEYFVVIDSGDSLFGTPLANHYSLFISTVPEDCENELDDDGDGRIDCDDPACFAEEHCTQGAVGEDCTDPWWFNAGLAVEADQTYVMYQTTVNRANDLSDPCAPASLEGPDTVHAFLLEEPMQVSASVYFDNQTWPALLLFLDVCIPDGFLACDVGTWSVAALDPAVLLPGTYYVVVDSGHVSAGVPAQSNYKLTLYTVGVEEDE